MERGFTLVETLIATAVMLLVTGALFAVLSPSQGAFQTQPEATDLQQRLRVAADAVARDLVMAGAGIDADASAGSLGRVIATVVPYRLGATSPDPPGIWRPDVLSVIYVPRTASQTTTALPLTPASATIDINLDPGCPVGADACGFAPGATAIIYDESGAWDLVAVAEVHATSVVRKSASRPLSKAYAAGARLAQVVVSVFSLKADRGTEVSQLRRYDGDQTDMPFVDDVVAMMFEYFGDPAPPMLDAGAGERQDPWTTYGPRPPPSGVTDLDTGYPAGENCVFKTQDGVQVPRLPALSSTTAALVPLPGSMFTDGPWCPGPGSSSRYDADLLRIRQVRVTLRAQAGAAALRGRDVRFFLRPGTSTDATRVVPDRQIQFDVAPRNLNLGR